MDVVEGVVLSESARQLLGRVRVKSRFVETYISQEQRYAIGIDQKVGGHYLAIPVSNGVVDYDEHYRLTPDQYQGFSRDSASALEFVEECRRREHDDQLIYPPSDRRGSPRWGTSQWSEGTSGSLS